MTDDDSAGFTVTESGGSTSATEDTNTDSFTVVRIAQPSSDVVTDVSLATRVPPLFQAAH
ncbi:MAG: hypothetical protein R3A45_03025 [Bdellovibrionota bacterium]